MTKPDNVLFEERPPLPILTSCDHYAGNPKFIKKALEIQADIGPLFDITCDLEDGAPVGDEIKLAKEFGSIISSSDNKFKHVGVRIHPQAKIVWKEELKMVLTQAGDAISHITIPKVKEPQDVLVVYEELLKLINSFDIKKTIPFHIMIETQAALKNAFKIASLPNIRCLDFGIMDFISGHDGVIPASAFRSPEQFEHALLKRAKATIVAAACFGGINAAHNVTVSFNDTEQTYQDAKRAREEFGFLRMWSIHPSQIEPILRAMRPSTEEVDMAGKILLEAQAKNWGPIEFENTLHDRASYRYYWQLLKRAETFSSDVKSKYPTLFQ